MHMHGRGHIVLHTIRVRFDMRASNKQQRQQYRDIPFWLTNQSAAAAFAAICEAAMICHLTVRYGKSNANELIIDMNTILRSIFFM